MVLKVDSGEVWFYLWLRLMSRVWICLFGILWWMSVFGRCFVMMLGCFSLVRWREIVNCCGCVWVLMLI